MNGNIDPGYSQAPAGLAAVVARLAAHLHPLLDPGFSQAPPGGLVGGRTDVGGQFATGALPGHNIQVTRPLHATGGSAAAFAAHRLAQLQSMGVDPYQLAGVSQSSVTPEMLPSLWRHVSPVMGQMLAQRAAQQQAIQVAAAILGHGNQAE